MKKNKMYSISERRDIGFRQSSTHLLLKTAAKTFESMISKLNATVAKGRSLGSSSLLW